MATELFINALLPPDRKLVSFTLRGADWKALRKDTDVDKSTKDQIYAYWHFENAVKDQYFGKLFNMFHSNTIIETVFIYHSINFAFSTYKKKQNSFAIFRMQFKVDKMQIKSRRSFVHRNC